MSETLHPPNPGNESFADKRQNYCNRDNRWSGGAVRGPSRPAGQTNLSKAPRCGALVTATGFTATGAPYRRGTST